MLWISVSILQPAWSWEIRKGETTLTVSKVSDKKINNPQQETNPDRDLSTQTIIDYPEKVLDYQTHLLADSMILTSYDWLYILKSIVVIYHSYSNNNNF